MMTRKKLNQIKFINAEIRQLEEELEKLKLDNTIQAKRITGMPFANTNETGNPVEELAMRIVECEHKLTLKRDELVKEKIDVIEYCQTLEDRLTRLIVVYRIIDGYTWTEIGKRLEYDRTTVQKRFRAFVKGLDNE